ncbi:MAG: histidine phosphatase family protein [Bulleidia sp.]
MKLTYYFVRHGETLFNAMRRIQGITDSPLTEKGIEQAKQARKALETVWFHHAYVSPSERCIDTCTYILEGRNMHAQILDDLHEHSFGELEGYDDDESRQIFQSHKDAFDFRSWGGENRDDVRERIGRVLAHTQAHAQDGDHILLVSHGAMTLTYLEYMGVDVEAYSNDRLRQGKPIIPNAGIMVFTYEDGTYTVNTLPTPPQDFVPERENKTVHFVYVRHGETKFNREVRFQGWCDSPLTQTGIAQARQVRDVLHDVPFAFACCSTALRTRTTAKLILEGRQMHALPFKDLREICMGSYEAWEYEPNRKILEPRSRQVHWGDVNGEEFEDVRKRMERVFALLTSRTKNNETVLVVSHGGYYINMLEILFGIDRNAYRDQCAQQGKQPMPNCGIFSFDVKDGNYCFTDFMKSAQQWRKETI